MWLTDEGGNFVLFPEVNVFATMTSQLGMGKEMFGAAEMNLNRGAKNIPLEIAGKRGSKRYQLGEILAVRVHARKRCYRVLEFNHVADVQIAEAVLPRAQIIVSGNGCVGNRAFSQIIGFNTVPVSAIDSRARDTQLLTLRRVLDGASAISCHVATRPYSYHLLHMMAGLVTRAKLVHPDVG